jgi:hypothetical protein
MRWIVELTNEKEVLFLKTQYTFTPSDADMAVDVRHATVMYSKDLAEHWCNVVNNKNSNCKEAWKANIKEIE